MAKRTRISATDGRWNSSRCGLCGRRAGAVLLRCMSRLVAQLEPPEMSTFARLMSGLLLQYDPHIFKVEGHGLTRVQPDSDAAWSLVRSIRPHRLDASGQSGGRCGPSGTCARAGCLAGPRDRVPKDRHIPGRHERDSTRAVRTSTGRFNRIPGVVVRLYSPADLDVEGNIAFHRRRRDTRTARR